VNEGAAIAALEKGGNHMDVTVPALETSQASPKSDEGDAYEDHWYRVLRAAADRTAAIAEGLEEERSV
jgi:hypothetical protein